MKRFRDDRYAFHNFQNAAGIDEVSLTTVNSAIVMSSYTNPIELGFGVNALEDQPLDSPAETDELKAVNQGSL